MDQPPTAIPRTAPPEADVAPAPSSRGTKATAKTPPKASPPAVKAPTELDLPLTRATLKALRRQLKAERKNQEHLYRSGFQYESNTVARPRVEAVERRITDLLDVMIKASRVEIADGVAA